MTSRAIEMIGLESGSLTVMERGPTSVTPNGTKKTMWRCRCRCGAVCMVAASDLRRRDGKRAKSCRECRSVKHGHTVGGPTPTYRIWAGMIARCRYDTRYIPLGVCDRWLDYGSFLEDMGERPSRLHSIERKDNEKGYGPDNCKWATRKEQMRNMRGNVRIAIGGRTMTLVEWLEHFGMSQWTYRSRIRAGMTPAAALETPVRRRRKHS